MNRWVKIILILLIVAIVFILPYIGFTLSDDMTLNKFAQQLFQLDLPKETIKSVESTSRNCDGTMIQYRVILSLKSNLSHEEMEAFYRSKALFPLDKANDKEYQFVVWQADDPLGLEANESPDFTVYFKKYDISGDYKYSYVVVLSDKGSGFFSSYDIRVN